MQYKLKNTTSLPSGRPLLLGLLTTLLLNPQGAAAAGDEERVVRRVERLVDCPDVAVLGPGVSMVSISPRGFLGVEASNLTPELRRHFGVPDDAGILLSRVVEDSAAAAAGLQVGDIVTRVDGEEITSASRLGQVIRRQEGGSTVDIEFWREGRQDQARATLEERRRCTVDIGDYLQMIDLDGIGVDLQELDLSGFAVSQEAIQDAMAAARDAFASQDWQEHIEGLQAIDLERLERRMERVQERLEELEERLDSEYRRGESRREERRERQRKRQQAQDDDESY
ncbi:MAG: PDZ domain-containing protein [Acidobacteriota bacterium]